MMEQPSQDVQQALEAVKVLVTVRRSQGMTLKQIMDEVGNEAVTQELVKTRGNISHASKNLKTNRATVRIYNKRKTQNNK